MPVAARSRPAEVPGPIILRAYYFCYLAAVGVSVPFFPPYLRSLGFSGRHIGWVAAAAPLMHMFGPLLWGWLSDRTRRPDLMLRLALAGAAFAYLPLAVASSLGAVLAIQLCHQSFNVALPGLSDTLSLVRVRAAGDDYGRIRFWGSLGFVVSCLLAGQVFAWRGRPGDRLLPMMVSGLLLLAFAVSWRLGGRGGKERPKWDDARLLLRDRRLQFILVMGGIHWASTVPYHAFLGVHVQDRGMDARVISYAFAVSVLCEMLSFFYFRHIKARAQLSTLLVVVSSVTAVRWVLTAWVQDPVWLVAAQTLHGVTFGLYWACALTWLSACVPENLRATGQTLFTGTTFGLAALLGALATGRIYDAAGSAAPAFLGAAALNLVSALVFLRWGRKLSPEG